MKMVALFAVLAVTGFSTLAQTPLVAQTAIPPAKTISIEANQTDVREVLRDIAAKTGGRILIGTEVTGKLTLHLTDVPLDQAVSIVTKMVSLRSNRIVVPPDKVDALTADQAAALVAAADTLKSAGILQVQLAGPSVVTFANSAPAPPGAVTVYIVQTKVDPAAIKAARDEARKKTADKDQTAREHAIALTLSPEARSDPGLVKAFTAVQSLEPDQIAVLMREFMSHSTPQQMQQIGDAIQRHNVPLDGSMPR